ncbi:MAG: hypothetical protein L0027_13105 [Candidatus Rokubacteria bacterium]|nr:hypothetical protein [Candidatus Rokubacteria bacterium]
MAGSILGGNAGGNCSQAMVDEGGNLDDDGTCGPGFGVLTGLDPELADNGGPTLTHALLAGSSAIGAAGECGLEADQRGFFRDDGACDSGAYEFGGTPPPPVGGATTGLELEKRVRCGNKTTGGSVDLVLEADAWDCEAEGLEVGGGDAVQMTITGVASGAGTVGGSVTGMTLRRVVCQNRTTMEAADIGADGETAWDCEAAGLGVSEGDNIRQILVGTAD